MVFGVLKVASVISRSLHSQESHLRVLKYVALPCWKQYGIIIFNFWLFDFLWKIMSGLLKLRLAGLSMVWANDVVFPSSSRFFKFNNSDINRIEWNLCSIACYGACCFAPTLIDISHLDKIHNLSISAMPLENVDQIIVSNLRVSGKEEDAFNYQPNKR